MKFGRIETASAVLVGNCGRFLFQIRDDIPEILYPGLIGLFGGHLETGETSLQAVCREVQEEVGIRLPPDTFSVLAECTVPVLRDKQLRETIFYAVGISVDQVEVSEGRLLSIERETLSMHLGSMTPITCCAVRILMERG